MVKISIKEFRFSSEHGEWSRIARTERPKLERAGSEELRGPEGFNSYSISLSLSVNLLHAGVVSRRLHILSNRRPSFCFS